MKHLKWLLVTLCLCPVLLTGCADLQNQIDLALYGTPEAAQEAQEKRAVYETEYRIKRDQEELRKYEEKLFAMINAERTKAKVRVKGMNEPMQECARVRARELAESFSHIRPNGQRFDTIKDDMTGTKPYWITSELRERTFGFGPQNIVNQWMRKDKTREVLLRYGAHHYAVGIYYDGSTYYCVFLMGSG